MSSQWEQACQGAELVSSKIVLLVQRANVVALAGVVEVVLDHRGARDDGELVVAGRTFRSRVAWRAGTRRDAASPRSRPLPGPPLINSTPGAVDQGPSEADRDIPPPFGPHLRAQLTAAPNHLGSRTRRSC